MRTQYAFLLLLAFTTLQSNAQDWLWSTRAGGAESDGAYRICTDDQNNIYVVANFTSDPCYYGSDTLHVISQSRFALAKYSPNGELLWVRSFGGADPPISYQGAHIAFDPVTHSIYMAGTHYEGFDSGCGVTNADDADCFVARLDTDGNCIWSKSFGGSGLDWLHGLALNGLGGIVIACTTHDVVTFDSITVLRGAVLASYDSSGTCSWAKRKFKPSVTPNPLGIEAEFYSIQVHDGDIYGMGLCGEDTLTVDGVSYEADVANFQYFISRLDASGDMVWMKPCAGRTTCTGCGDLAVGDDGSVYATGPFDQDAIFGDDTLHTVTDLASDLFVAKYNADGAALWAWQAQATAGCVGHDIMTMGSGGIYVIGSFIDSVSFVDGINYSDVSSLFIAAYDSSGECIALRTAPNSVGFAVTSTGNNTFAIAGKFENTLALGGTPELTSAGNYDILVAKSDLITGIGKSSSPPYEDLLIYANPNQGTCQVMIPEALQHERELWLQIYDAQGKLIQSTRIVRSDARLVVDLRAEAKGTYHAVLIGAPGSRHGMIVFE